MSRRSPTAVPMTHTNAFVLGRLRDGGTHSSRDFSEARRRELSSGHGEWASKVLIRLEVLGYATSRKAGRNRIYSINDAGVEAIRDLPPTPRRMSAMADAEGISVCSAVSRRMLAGETEVDLQKVELAMGLDGELDEAELAEARRILALIEAERALEPASVEL